MLKYIAERYKDILCNQGLSYFFKEFPRFHRAIERFVQKERIRKQLDGLWIIIPGLIFLPMYLSGLVDDSLYRSSKPFSGPTDSRSDQKTTDSNEVELGLDVAP